MNAVELLKKQHRDLDKLFREFEGLSEEAQSRRQELFIQIADLLSAHTSIEEKFFYPSVKNDQTEQLLLTSLEEHLSVKRLIADLLDLDPADPVFNAKMWALKEQVQHHVGEEEGELFPLVRKALDRDELDSLGAVMEAELDDLRRGETRAEGQGVSPSPPIH